MNTSKTATPEGDILDPMSSVSNDATLTYELHYPFHLLMSHITNETFTGENLQRAVVDNV